ncbi:hypothetical protein HZS_2553 [Henneguya salminicola]|nr:hypothetical protein HZS_2553 [Henneguya salminicola]
MFLNSEYIITKHLVISTMSKDLKNYSESSLKTKCDINDLRLTLLISGKTIFGSMLNSEMYKVIKNIPKVSVETSESSIPNPIGPISHEIITQKQKIIKKLKLDHIHPYLPIFPKPHTFLHNRVSYSNCYQTGQS